MEFLTADDFAPKEGLTFQMIFEVGDPLDLALVSVKRSRVYDYPGKQRDPFSLFFEGTKGVHCQQGLYRLRDETGWQADVFLVPIGDKPDGTYIYQAVFN